MFRHLILSALVLLSASTVYAISKPVYVPGSELTLIGKLLPTTDRYARVDSLEYGGFTDFQRRNLNITASGLALVFNTDSRNIYANFDYEFRNAMYNTNDIAIAGCDLYIRRDGKWVYAGSGVPSEKGKPVALVENMAPGEKECLLYLPLRSIIREAYVGVDSGATITAAPNPFRHKIVFWGSSYTHGTSTSRAGIPYQLQFQRATGLDVCSLGVGGNSKLQQSYARVLADTDAEAFVFDAFSNPTAAEIYERFDDFLKTIRAKHPETPIIFQQTIHIGARNFNTLVEKSETAKMKAAEEVVRKAMETDPNIYMVYPHADTDGYSCSDKIHPSDLGYNSWMNSIRQPILDILSKYGITSPSAD